MKKLLAISIMSVAFASTANSSYNNNMHLTTLIKTNPTIGSKPTVSPLLSTSSTVSPFVKLASVSFLTDRKNGIKFRCFDGYAIEEGRCRPQRCDGYRNMSLGKLQNCLSKDSCLSGEELKFKCTSCKPNLVSDGNGGCICDRAVYPRTEDSEACPDGSDTYQETCTEYDDSGIAHKYYKECLCSGEYWKICDSSKNLTGEGIACRSQGRDYYQNCTCKSAYRHTCDENGEIPLNSMDYCVNPADNKKYYAGCYSCDVSQGLILDYDDYWCEDLPAHDGKWIDFPEIGNLESFYK